MKLKGISVIHFTAVLMCSHFAMASESDNVLCLNLSQTFDPVKQKLADGGIGNIAVIGDSLSFRGGTWIYTFIDKMQSEYGFAGSGYQGASVWTGAGFNPGWNNGQINQDTSPHQSLDGLWASTTAQANGFIQPTDQWNKPLANQTTTLQYVIQPGGGSFDQFYWGTNGAVVTSTVNTNGNLGLGELTFNSTTTPDNKPWYRTSGTGPVTILGEINKSGNPGVMISRIANGGWGVNNFLQRDWTFDEQLKSLDADLYFIWLGQNDQWVNTPADYAAKMIQLIERIKADTPDAKFCLIGSYDSGSPNISKTVEGMRQAAIAEGAGFINIHDWAGDYAFFQSNGYLDDAVHFSAAGGNYLGDNLYQAFQTNGANIIVPEPGTITLGLSSIGLLLLRRNRASKNQ